MSTSRGANPFTKEERLLKQSDRGAESQRDQGTRVQWPAAGKYQWDDRSGGDADKDVKGEAISKYSWSDGKKTVSIYIELHGLDDVAEAAFKAESGATDVSLTMASVVGKQRTFKLTGLANSSPTRSTRLRQF